jgi:hypothetical protein
MAVTTNSEAEAINTLLRHDLAIPQPGFGVPDSRAARTAALLLAESAFRKHGAGLTPAHVDAAWPADPDGTLERLAAAVSAFRRATLAFTVAPESTERAALADLLGLVNEIRGWAATTLETVAASVTADLPYAAARGYIAAVASVADAQDGIDHTIAVLTSTGEQQ